MALIKSLKGKKIGRWIAIALVCLLIFSVFTGKSNIIRLYQSHTEVKNRLDKKQRLHHEIDSLKIENTKLKTDTAYIEKIAREKLGMARKDEKVYKFIGESKP